MHLSSIATEDSAPVDSDAEERFDLQASTAGRALLQRYLESPRCLAFGSGGVRAYALSSWQSEAERAARVAALSLPRIASELGVPAGAVLPVWIVVSGGGGSFAREAPTWSAAIAQPQRHLIVISGPAIRGARMSLEETVAHEVTHLVLGVRLDDVGWVPRWFDEGLAMRLSGYHRLTDGLALLGRGPLHLHELTDAFPRDARLAQQAYLESEAAVRRLQLAAPLTPLLDRLAAGAEFDSAFAAVYGQTSGEFETEVYDEVSRRWRYISALGGSLSAVTVMTLLFLMGFLRIRARNRRRMREWDAAEAGLALEGVEVATVDTPDGGQAHEPHPESADAGRSHVDPPPDV